MNGNDALSYLNKLSEEERRFVIVQSLWDVENVNDRIEYLKEDYDMSKLTDEDKLEALTKAIDYDGDRSQEDLVQTLDDLLIESAQRK